MSASPALVFEATEADFDRTVIEASHTRPVLVDFWADWCQPCKMLMPVLARLVEQLRGQVLLAKVNTDEQQGLAMRMGIRSLPTVRLFRGGRAVAEFMGAQPEQAIRAFLAQHLEGPGDDARRAARASLEAGDLATAERLLRAALAQTPGSTPVSLDLASVLLAAGRADEAEAVLDALPTDATDDDAVKRLRGQVGFARRAGAIADTAALDARLQDADADAQSLHDGAALRVAQGRFDEALELMLQLLERDRAFGDDAARRDMLAVFDMLGASSPLVREYRRRMASALF